jgi:hypothetical protein
MFLVVTMPHSGESETIYPLQIESMRPSSKRMHTPQANTIIRSVSGREIAVVEDYDELVEAWRVQLDMLERK